MSLVEEIMGRWSVKLWSVFATGEVASVVGAGGEAHFGFPADAVRAASAAVQHDENFILTLLGLRYRVDWSNFARGHDSFTPAAPPPLSSQPVDSDKVPYSN